ncbi:MAG: hypothetical protein KDE59_18205, partial [Anaerolineales bacterium]|nr:hypothetical protein [Anaerolineales bacterium]
DYLTRVVLQALAAGPEQLVVIDGRGDLVRSLKRQSSVVEKLRRDVMLVEMDGLTARGFDPLVAVGPADAESESQQLARWRRWFAGQGVAPAGLALLDQAYQEGCRDWPALRSWVKRNQAGSFLAQSSLHAALERLTAPADVALWLAHSNRQAIPHMGALLFSCSDSDTSRHHYLTAVLLAALNLPAVRLVVYGFDWRGFDLTAHASRQQLFLANGPRLANDQLLLTAGADPSLLPVASPEWAERLQLLTPGEGLLLPPAGRADLSSVTYLHW